MFRYRFLSMVIAAGLLFSQSIPAARAATVCNSAQFVSDLTIPDGSAFAPGSTFVKKWRLQNNGTCAWTTSYKLLWAGGDSLNAPASTRIPVSVPPGQMLDLSVTLTAPSVSGHFRALFKLSNAAGTQFGIGASSSDAFWVDINSVDTSAVIYDFVANAPYAQWKSGAGALPFPGASGDFRGYSSQVSTPHLEDDSFDTAAGLLTVPQNKLNGYIQATYPEFQIQSGDKLQTLINCEFGATGCYVTFRIDYILPNNVQRTLWTFRESYDRRFYRANLDLSSLAGQKVRFVFMLLASGSASADRAIWGSPRVVRTGSFEPPSFPATLTPLPALTPTATPLATPPPTVPAAGCDKAAFITDITVPDGAVFAPGSTFTKTWRLKNSGACVWTPSYKLIYYSGEQMGGPTTINFPWGVTPNQSVDLSVNMTAPSSPGPYRGYWILANANGQFFGIGPDASRPIWVDINVAGEATTEGGYDFAFNACSAQWRTGSGPLPCPGTEGDSKGFVIPMQSTQLEDGTMGPAPSLLMGPENKYNGYIQGVFPAFTVQPRDHFVTGTGCQFGYSCYVTFRLDYMTANGGVFNFWSWREQQDNRNNRAEIDLSPLAGRSVRFILTILATGSASNDRVRWIGPYIVRVEGGTPPTITPAPSTWPTYTNPQYGFQFKYPPSAQILTQSANDTKISLPIAPGTNLADKYLEASVVENVTTCQSPLSATSPPGSPRETVVINGISFLKQTGGDAAAGNLYEWTAYSTLHGNSCVSMDFMLHSLGAIFPQPPVFDKAGESVVFTQIMSTFGWPPATATPTPVTVPGTLTPAPLITRLFMIDSSYGWAIGRDYVLKTADGGATWYNFSMPGVASVRNAFFQNANKGWVMASLMDDPNKALLFRTTNGGSTWTTYNNLPFNDGLMQFLDDANGFVLAGQGIGMQKHPVMLYQTSNGGASWTLKFAHNPNLPVNGLPLSGHKAGMTFRNPSRGWIGGDIPISGSVYLYRTDDSGVNWMQQPMAIPAGYENAIVSTTAPIFFGSNDAVLPVWMSLDVGQRNLFLYITRDGGTTWSRSSAFAQNSFNADFTSIRDAFSWDPAGFLRRTSNSGANWVQVTPNVNFGEGVRDLDFVSTTTGWVLDSDENGNTALYRTNDGGATWTLLFGTTAPATQTPTPPATPAPSSAELLQTVVNALNAKNFEAAKNSMGQTFVMAFWQSQGNSYTPDEAIQQFQTNYIGASTVLVSDQAKDLTALLNPTDPYSVVGLHSSDSLALFVSGWGLDGKGEAVLYVTQGTGGQLYWHSVLIAPTGFAPATLPVPYAVVRVAPGALLNIHLDAGENQPVTGSFAFDAVNVRRTGPSVNTDNATWVEVINPGGSVGWVNAEYLTEYVTHDAFCADPRIPVLIEQLKGSVDQSNGDMFAGLVGTKHGAAINFWRDVPPVNYTSVTARSIFSDPTAYNWGSGPASGPSGTLGTFTQIVQPDLVDVFNSGYQLGCDDPSRAAGVSANPWPHTNIHYYSILKPPTSDTALDWKVWLIGFEYVDGVPYLYSTARYVWGP